MNYPNRIIKEGEQDKAVVKAIQERLNALGLGPFEVSGNFGPKTKSAIKLFQSTHRDQNGNPLEIDGKVGSITWAVLFDSPVSANTGTSNDLLAEAIKVAQSQVGVMEDPPGSNRGKEVNKYLASVDCPPGSFWCAAFVYFCFKTAAENLHQANPLVKTGGCLDHWNRTRGKKIKSADAIDNPSLIKPGAIFIIDHGNGMGHTGIIEKQEGGFIHTIEGNSNPSGSSNGIGVFKLQRKIAKINKGFYRIYLILLRMTSAAEKTIKPALVARKQEGRSAFFRKANDGGFFTGQESQAFFAPSVQPKLTISQPDDPYEKEADQVAESVMRMPEPETSTPAAKDEDKIQLKEEEKKEEELKEEDRVQPKLEHHQISTLQRQQDKEDDKALVQPKLSAYLQRSQSASHSIADGDIANTQSNVALQLRSGFLYRSALRIQRSGRAPPSDSDTFEHNLSSSNGGGSALPDMTRAFMESRFNADFSGVRIHTGSTAEMLSQEINARAFTHGNNIYFNSGKYSPHTASGGALLAHELTHTIQQGASKAHAPATVARKSIIQRSADNSASIPQLSNAISKAKAEEGKVNANKDGPDGYRVGWQRLLEYFKTTFGEEKIVNNSSAAVPGTVPEENIKKRKKALGMKPNQERPSTQNTEMRDAMPSWCGIFVFWALNKAGVPMPKWKLGGQNIKLDSARPPGALPQPGDIAYRGAFSHFALVEKANGNIITTVNGNTSGEDNLGAQIQTRDHPLSNWTAFFDPIKNKTGDLTSGEAITSAEPKTFRELRKQVFNVDRKAEDNIQEETAGTPGPVQTKPELSSWHINASGNLSHEAAPVQADNKEKVQPKEEEQKKEEENAGGSTESSLQRKAGSSFEHNWQPAGKSGSPGTKAGGLHATEVSADSILPYNTAIHRQEETSEDSRGPPAIQQKTGAAIQRSVVDDALSFVGSLTDCITTDLDEAKRCGLQKAQQVAMHIPGYKALRVVLGQDPITGADVERNGRNFIEAAFDIMPGGDLLYQKLDEIHQLDAAAAWIDTQIATIESLVNSVYTKLERFWDQLDVTDFLTPIDVLRQGANIVIGFINSIIAFAINAASELLRMVKDYLLSKIVDFIKNQTPAYPLLTVILGKDPITGQKVERNGTNILNALLELGGEEGREQRRQMQETGSFNKVAGYIDEGIAVFSGAYEQIVQGFRHIWDHVSINSLMDPVGTFTEIYNEFAEPVRKVWAFVTEVGAAILRFIKEVLMVRLANWAKTVRGYTLVTVIIGKDPFTQQKVPRNTENIIKGFMSLMDGGEQQFEQLQQSGAIGRIAQKVDKAVARLNMTPQSIIQLFVDLWNSFSLNDLRHPIEAFRRILNRFGEPIGRLIAFVVEIVKIVIEAILIIMNFPFDLINNIIAKAMQAFELIKADPVGFLKNLLRSIKEGFIQFFNNILVHLWNGLKAWFLSEVEAAGIPIPTDYSLMGIIKWLLVVLDITMEKIWKKLEERIGKEKVNKIKSLIDKAQRIAGAAGEAYEFVKDVQERGFMAVIADKIKEKLSNVWDMVLEAVQSFVMEQIVNKVTAKLLSMLDPTGIMAVINSAIALYKAIQSFIRYLRQMLEIVNSFVEGTLEIAQGATKRGADFLENSLARGVPIVIGFLANQVGLNLSERLKDALELVRAKVDAGLTWVIDKLVTLVEKLIQMGREAVEALMNWLGVRTPFKSADGHEHNIYFTGSKENAVLMVASTPSPVETFLAGKKDKDPDALKAYNYYTGTIKKEKEQVEKLEKEYKGETDKEKKRAARYKHQVQVETLRDKMKEFAEKLSKLKYENEGVTTRTKVTKGSDGKTKWVSALPLTYLPGDYVGSPPSQDPPGWKNYAQNSSDKWVRGHMLSEHLHGPGVNWNLIPISQSVNSSMASVEASVKPLLSNQDKQYFYTTTAIMDDTLAGDAKYIPKSVAISWGTAKQNESDPTKFDPVDTHNEGPFTQGLPTLAGAPNLNNVGRDTLINNGVMHNLAQDIVTCRDYFTSTKSFGNLQDLISQMNSFYSTELSASTPEKKLKKLGDLHIANLNEVIVIKKAIEIKP